MYTWRLNSVVVKKIAIEFCDNSKSRRRRCVEMCQHCVQASVGGVIGCCLWCPIQEHPSRQGFIQHVQQLIMKLADTASVDAACDQMGKQFIHDSMPPMLSDGTAATFVKCQCFGFLHVM